MSNHLAVAAATRTLTQLLERELNRDFAGAHVVPGRPDATATDDSDPEVRLFLYRVEPDGSHRTDALPTRSPSGDVLERPRIGLNLHYLLTFVGNESQLEPQRMLGSVVRTLNARPLLTRGEVDAMVEAARTEDANHPLVQSDLAEQADIVRLSPLPLTLDELSTLWSSFFQAPYRLSVAYEACVIVLTADETPTRALPVRERRLFPTTMVRPTVQQVMAVAGAFTAITVGTTLVITGSQLRGDEITVVAFGGVEVTPAPNAGSGNRIEIVVPAAVRAGVTGLRVVHRRMMGEPPAARLAAQSSAFPVVIQPRMGAPAAEAVDVTPGPADPEPRSGRVKVGVDPPVGSRQHVTMMLNAVPGGTGQSFVFEDDRRDGDADPDETSELEIPFAAVPAGTYLVRITVDGAETPLTVDTTAGSPTEGQYVGPRVVVP